MSDARLYFATAPRGLSDLLARELAALGALELHESAGGVRFSGPLEVGYRACLCSRIASRVLLELAEFEAADDAAFHRAVAAFDWAAHIDPARTIACDFTGLHPAITHTHYGALRLKDGICDRLRSDTGSRPDVQLARPAVRVHAHAHGARITLSLDLAGEGLHARGYRLEAGAAPLRENLAAGVLLRARWDEAAARGAEFLDPMCGSGTLVIEAALIASDRAPGLLREYFGFLGWRGHDAALWRRLLEQARARARNAVANLIRGSDLDQRALAAAHANARRAGIDSLVRFEHRAVDEIGPATPGPGLICVNPPYGERLGDAVQAATAHAHLGRALRERFTGWDAAVLTAHEAAARELRLRSYRVHELWNGAIVCRLLRFDLGAPGSADGEAGRRAREQAAAESPGAKMFANRLAKNLKRLGKAAQRAAVSCYRLYDADMPEYAFAIDRYVESGRERTGQTGDERVHLLVQEYAPPAVIAADDAQRRRREALAVLPRLLAVAPERIHQRLRARQSGAAQYQPLDTGCAAPFVVEEGGLRFQVNLEDYLDSGLFLDHRLTRERLRQRARGAHFLNLFCYTASATVYAAAGGAAGSLSLDLSNGHLDWAAQNFALNGLDRARHRLERADCLDWLEADDANRYELIFLDPPTFSNSKRMQGVLDIQRDHLHLIEGCMRRLAPGGLLLFACNAQRFRLDARVGERWLVSDTSARTLPFDFTGNPRIHRCFEISALPA
ncbi:MAG TPA: bifunctional 23S rRNA (guanine(2069)-N(7))-methyltransferase RlmK/23S rRNA (guanine(2445)-N(2))-methyltransferase RlmL [Steroidobacteraceae bacterium]